MEKRVGLFVVFMVLTFLASSLVTFIAMDRRVEGLRASRQADSLAGPQSGAVTLNIEQGEHEAPSGAVVIDIIGADVNDLS
jgi:hypothetical protein|tara:strand:+ start:476 stop:718 length:243 start_codon:yes stop_codon:yes gene_type:complete